MIAGNRRSLAPRVAASCRRMASFVAAAALLFACSPAQADEPPPASPTPAVSDPARVALHYREVTARPEFEAVDDDAANFPRVEDLLARWFKGLGEKMGTFKYGSRMPAFESLLMSLLVVLSIGVLVYIVLRLTRGRSWRLENRDAIGPKDQKLPVPESYDDEIENAVREQNWRGAWLATWRQFLSRLERGSLVEADRTRTNREYLGQLQARTLPAAALSMVSGMVDSYDRVIYGRARIAEDDWNFFHQQVEEAALFLHLGDNKARAINAPV